jgi:curved DNA-binding protein CbpA
MSIDESYKILGLQPGASIDEVKAARNEMLEVWHPDRFQHKPDLARKATEQTKQINNAYDIRLSL